MGRLLDSPTLLLLIVVIPLVLVVWVAVRMLRGRRPAPTSTAQPVAAGWYPQPDGTTRWWDGMGWTDDTPPAPPPPN
jgi:hypothetical protein